MTTLAKIAQRNFAPAVIVSVVNGFKPKKLGRECAATLFGQLRSQWSKRQAIAMLQACVDFLCAFCVAFTKKSVELMKK